MKMRDVSTQLTGSSVQQAKKKKDDTRTAYFSTAIQRKDPLGPVRVRRKNQRKAKGANANQEIRNAIKRHPLRCVALDPGRTTCVVGEAARCAAHARARKPNKPRTSKPKKTPVQNSTTQGEQEELQSKPTLIRRKTNKTLNPARLKKNTEADVKRRKSHKSFWGAKSYV